MLLSNNKQQVLESDSDFSQFHQLRVVTIGVIGILLTIFLVASYFLYQRIFSTINEVHSILLLTNEYGTEIIDFPAYERVKSAWDTKHASSDLVIPRDPFAGALTAPVPSGAATPKPTNPTPGVSRSL